MEIIWLQLGNRKTTDAEKKKNTGSVPERLKLVIKRGSRQAWDRAKAAWQTNDLLFNLLWTNSTIKTYVATINFFLVLLLSFFFFNTKFCTIHTPRTIFFFIDHIVYNNLKKTRQPHWRSKYKYKTSDTKGDKITRTDENCTQPRKIVIIGCCCLTGVSIYI